MQSKDSSTTLDRGKFAAMLQAVYPRLAMIAIGIIGDRSFADDIVQDAAIVGLRRLEDFEQGTNFAAWMAAIVKRTALNYARKTRNRSTYATDPSTFDNQTAQGESSEGSPINSAGQLVHGQSDFDDDVVEALGLLSDDARCCLLLRSILDLSYAEIAVLLDVPEGTAMSHVHRSKATMRKRLIEKSGHRENLQ